ncbi:PilZ domain-containing protein [Colwellia sp. BRX8-7]|jgi:c-di-GMP-binding flagellar brake protein YcgR|uniref:PilZ domain-containing protein n=1 Tax=unclassified Colwellia TaxID=196834 RepID=UPI0015F6A2A4|nr:MULTISPECIES: PilZ domain-containing protein [unclassified Colwellia]MBA6336562.1 PilZ domain-containing protein [Colwellia sp. BRX8-7]MBA6383558.1 PilZ domain-containing protein [Colwellia sp. BRX10-9]MBA6393595.1 PilZ domain-containing protein [Colwellia sp. BRX10-6]
MNEPKPNQSSDDERRQSFRLDMEKELVDIRWVNDQQQTVQRKITCLDFSRGGLKLDCDHVIPLQTKVTVVFKVANPNSQNLYGTVIRCIKQPNGYFELALRLENENAK